MTAENVNYIFVFTFQITMNSSIDWDSDLGSDVNQKYINTYEEHHPASESALDTDILEVPSPNGTSPIEPLIEDEQNDLNAKLICSHCDKKFTRMDNLKRHMKKHAGYNVKCAICELMVRDKFDLRTHIRRVHKHETFSCSLCDKSFRHQSTLNAHIQLHKSVFRFQCDICGSRYNNSAQFTLHVNNHHGVKPHVCGCGSAFGRPGNLKRHKMSCGRTKDYSCANCTKVFKSELMLTRHASRHQSKPTCCHKCGKTYVFKQSLNKHQRKCLLK